MLRIIFSVKTDEHNTPRTAWMTEKLSKLLGTEQPELSSGEKKERDLTIQFALADVRFPYHENMFMR